MKNIFMSLVVAASLFATSCGTTYKSTTDNAAYNVSVPPGIKGNFATTYPDATNVTWNRYDAATLPIDWELTGWRALDTDDYVVTFDMGNNRYHAWYDSNGTWVGTSSTLKDPHNLPAAVHTVIQNRFKDYTISKVEREMWGNQVAYEIKLVQGENKAKLLIDTNGQIIKEKLKD
jgi:hypothetical protein